MFIIKTLPKSKDGESLFEIEIKGKHLFHIGSKCFSDEPLINFFGSGTLEIKWKKTEESKEDKLPLKCVHCGKDLKQYNESEYYCVNEDCRAVYHLNAMDCDCENKWEGLWKKEKLEV